MTIPVRHRIRIIITHRARYFLLCFYSYSSQKWACAQNIRRWRGILSEVWKVHKILKAPAPQNSLWTPCKNPKLPPEQWLQEPGAMRNNLRLTQAWQDLQTLHNKGGHKSWHGIRNVAKTDPKNRTLDDYGVRHAVRNGLGCTDIVICRQPNVTFHQKCPSPPLG